MRILLSGSSGFIGAAVLTSLRQSGHEVSRLVRRQASKPDEIGWTPQTGRLEPAPQNVDAVVHLAGESLIGLWPQDKRKSILDSRVVATRLLAEELARLPSRPRHFLCASAVGIYGDRGDDILTESSPPGGGFLAEVCVAWEDACRPAAEAGMRVTNLRMGLVLGARGGALKAMLTPFRLGLGGKMGDGRQYWSWISLEDTVCAIIHVLEHEQLLGPVNLVTPEPVTNEQFTCELGRVLNKPTFLRVPATMLRLAAGRMADEMLLASARVMPQRLQESGFVFKHPDLEECLRAILSGNDRGHNK